MNSRMDYTKNVETYEIDLYKERERVEEKRFLKDGLSRRATMNTRMETYEIDLFKERERVEEKRFLKDGLSRRAAMNTRFHSGSYEKLGKACKRVASEDPPEKIDALSTKESLTTPVVNEFDWETFKKKMQRDSSANRTPRVRQKSTTSVGRRNNIFFSSSPSLHDDSSLNDNEEDDLEKRTRSMTIG